MTAPVLRAGRDADGDGFIALLTACWLEYPGCVVDIDGESPELHALASYFAARDGALWAAEQAGRVVGMIGTRPLGGGVWELCKVYAYADQRGTGLAQALVAAAEDFARGRGAVEMKLWSDTRFDRAHRFYEKLFYVREGAIRVLSDLSNTLEFGYAKPLAGVAVRTLDAAAAGSAEVGLARLGGDKAIWRKISSAVALGNLLLLVAWVDGVLTGAVTLDLATPVGQRHRAALHAWGVTDAALLQRAEQAARAAGRRLLTVEVVEDDPAETVFRQRGWIEAGRIPGYLTGENYPPKAMSSFYKFVDC